MTTLMAISNRTEPLNSNYNQYFLFVMHNDNYLRAERYVLFLLTQPVDLGYGDVQ